MHTLSRNAYGRTAMLSTTACNARATGAGYRPGGSEQGRNLLGGADFDSIGLVQTSWQRSTETFTSTATYFAQNASSHHNCTETAPSSLALCACWQHDEREFTPLQAIRADHIVREMHEALRVGMYNRTDSEDTAQPRSSVLAHTTRTAALGMHRLDSKA